jgi:alkanesulfonate monooxygenase SsuD/methylene tetrahydromethanopterin reductase-like flavin-dependent oxidoreductase (luciferase family)
MDRFEEATQILRSRLGRPRTSFCGRYYQLQDAPNQPAPVQDPMPLLVGAAASGARSGSRPATPMTGTPGPRRSCWSTRFPCCVRTARRPGEIRVSTQALLFLSTDKEWLAGKRRAEPGQPGPPRIVGTPDEVTDIVARYRDAGADELIIPDFTIRSLTRAKDTCDLFMQEVAPAFR